MKLCLYEPEIAQNAGTLARMCVCFGVELNIIEPASFIIDDKNFKRAGMDYLNRSKIVFHESFKSFRKNFADRIILLDVKAQKKYYDLEYRENDCIMVGKESCGVPHEVYKNCDEQILIPMNPDCRSLNVAISAGICIGEALRQTKYAYSF